MRSGSRGFTLLEVLIATAIMGIGIVGALELFSGSLHLAANAGQQNQAVILARALVDEELWRDVLEETQRAGTEGIYSWSVATHPIERGLVSRDEEEEEFHDVTDEMGLWMIEAEVSWQAASGAKRIRFETARMGLLPE